MAYVLEELQSTGQSLLGGAALLHLGAGYLVCELIL